MVNPVAPSMEFLDCPTGMAAIVEYLDLEDHDRSTAEPIFFFREEADSKKLWVWKYIDAAGETAYVAVTQPKPPPRPDWFEIGCGPAGSPNETAAEALALFARAGLS